MYLDGEQKEYKLEIIDEQVDEAGIKSLPF